jgi:hypothetical protein
LLGSDGLGEDGTGGCDLKTSSNERGPTGSGDGYELGGGVDVIGRSIEVRPDEAAVAAIGRYLEQGYTRSARLIASRPVVFIHPAQLLGSIIAAHEFAQ